MANKMSEKEMENEIEQKVTHTTSEQRQVNPCRLRYVIWHINSFST